jgi:holo-[acyl-carrier protein] synthase
LVKGIGLDIIEIKRIAKAIESAGFLEKYFTRCEIELMANKRALTAAGNFAAKEAASKALGTGFRNFSPADIEILRDDYGKPYVKLYGFALNIFERQNFNAIYVSISHCEEYAAAAVVIE